MKEIILGGGLMNARGRSFKPLARFQTFLEQVEWPGWVGRLPINVRDLISQSQLYFNYYNTFHR